jgi:hypothetical protein
MVAAPPSVAILAKVRPSWLGSMQCALAATLTNPEWWAIALAAFLVRGGIVLVLVPIVALPTPARLVTELSPGVQVLLLGAPSLAGALLVGGVVILAMLVLTAAGLAGAWLDAALVREAAAADDLELAWHPVAPSAWRSFGLRLVANVPTVLALGYAAIRVVTVAFEQFTRPDDPGVPIVDRVVGRVPDAILLVLAAWLVGEVVGGLAARRAAAGMTDRAALVASVRQLLSPRGLATFAVTTGLLLVTVLPFVLAAGRAWEHARSYLLVGADPVQLVAAVVALVATWVLGLAIVGAALAWRATAWTAETRPS